MSNLFYHIITFLAVFLSEQVDVLVLVKLILIKVFIGLIMGVVIDLIVRRSSSPAIREPSPSTPSI